MLHITCCTNGFYVSQSSDSVFNAAASEQHSTVYSTLCHLLVAVSPAFAAWYKQHVEEGDRTEKFSLEEILDSLPTLASNTIPPQHWFASSQDDTVSVELLHQAAQLLAGETLPYLSSDVTPAPNWLQEYNLVKDQEWTPSCSPSTRTVSRTSSPRRPCAERVASWMVGADRTRFV